eukprot:3284294-Alexandrium_andersonii.AAC.1
MTPSTWSSAEQAEGPKGDAGATNDKSWKEFAIARQRGVRRTKHSSDLRSAGTSPRPPGRSGRG